MIDYNYIETWTFKIILSSLQTRILFDYKNEMNEVLGRFNTKTVFYKIKRYFFFLICTNFH